MKFSNGKFSTSFRIIIFAYIVAMFLFSLLLYLPIPHLQGVDISYSEALFTSVSAVSVTGLTAVNIPETYSYVGIAFLAIAVQLGGIGIITLGTFIWMILGGKIILSQRMLIMVDQNQSNLTVNVRVDDHGCKSIKCGRGNSNDNFSGYVSNNTQFYFRKNRCKSFWA